MSVNWRTKVVEDRLLGLGFGFDLVVPTMGEIQQHVLVALLEAGMYPSQDWTLRVKRSDLERALHGLVDRGMATVSDSGHYSPSRELREAWDARALREMGLTGLPAGWSATPMSGSSRRI